MKFIRVIKARWDNEDNFTSFQDDLKHRLEEYSDIINHLSHLYGNLVDLETYLDSYMLDKEYKFLNPRIKKMLKSAFNFTVSEDFWSDLDSILSLNPDIELTTQSEYRTPDSVEKFISSLEDVHNKIMNCLNLLREDIEEIPDYGSKVYKIGVLRDIEKLEKKIDNIMTKCFDYLDQEYGIK